MPGSGFSGRTAASSVENIGWAKLAASDRASSTWVGFWVGRTASTARLSRSRLFVYDCRISAVELNTITMPVSASVAASISLRASALAHSSRFGLTSVADMLAELSIIKM